MRMWRVQGLVVAAAVGLGANGAAAQYPLPVSPSAQCLATQRRVNANAETAMVSSGRVFDAGVDDLATRAGILFGGARPQLDQRQGAIRSVLYSVQSHGAEQMVVFTLNPQAENRTLVTVGLSASSQSEDFVLGEVGLASCAYLDALGGGSVRSGGAIGSGATVLGTLEDPSAVHRYTFAGQRGQKMVVEATVLAPDLSERQGTLRVSLRDPAGQRVDQFTPGIVQELEAAGTYTIQVDQQNGPMPTTYHLRYTAVDVGVETGAAAIVPGTPFEGALEYDGDEDRYPITLRAGQEVSVKVEMLDWRQWADVAVEVLHPASHQGYARELTQASSVQGGFSMPEQVETSGVHHVRIVAAGSGEYVGRYRVTVRVID